MPKFFEVLRAAIANETSTIGQRILVDRVMGAIDSRQTRDLRRVEFEGRPMIPMWCWPNSPVGDVFLVEGHLLPASELVEVETGCFRRREPAAPVLTPARARVGLWNRVPGDRRERVARSVMAASRAFSNEKGE